MKNQILLLLVGDTLNVFDLIAQAGFVVKMVMLLLLVASIISWTIIFWKWWLLRNAIQWNEKFSESFWAAGSLEAASQASKTYPHAPMASVFETGLQEVNQIKSLKTQEKEEVNELLETNVVRSLNKASSLEMIQLQSYLSVLANTASAAPFIGLFGTVWGIMTSFINIGATGASNLAVVAPGIAEALIATAMGLFAAIPAVLFYNYFVNKIKVITNGMKGFESDFLNAAKRSL